MLDENAEKAIKVFVPQQLIDPDCGPAENFVYFYCAVREAIVPNLLLDCQNSGAGAIVFKRFKKGFAPMAGIVVITTPGKHDFVKCISGRYQAAPIDKVSLAVRIKCEDDFEYSANLQSEGYMISSFRECNAVLHRIMEIHMGYEKDLAGVLEQYFPQALEKASIKDPGSHDENARILVAPEIHIEMTAINAHGHNYNEPLYRGDLRFETVKYVKKGTMK